MVSPTKYAQKTTVPYQRSLEEIQTLLVKYGATKFAYITDNDNNFMALAFERQKRLFRFTIPLPDPNSNEIKFVNNGFRGKEKRSPQQVASVWEKVVNQRYRALLMIIKAKLVAIDEGISTFESEFLDSTLIPGTNQTVGEWAQEQLTQGYLTGIVPPLLPPSL